MPQDNSLTTFLQFLKLGIYLKGSVKEWGNIENIYTYPDDAPGKNYFVRKPPEQYLNANCFFFKKQLGIGVYLHDYYLLHSVIQGSRRLSTFVVVISTCRMKGVFEERLHYLKITNRQRSNEFRQTIMKSTSAVASNKQIKLKRSYGSIRKSSNHDNGPMAVNRKMK